jgi:hypothetical protein
MAEILLFLMWLCIYAIAIYFVIWAIIKIVDPPARVVQLLYVLGVLILAYYLVAYFPAAGLPMPRRRF